HDDLFPIFCRNSRNTNVYTLTVIFEMVRVNNTEFLARATSITDFDGDGILNVWEIDKNKIPREVVPD
ncbi:MAG: hypothetical protein AAF135_16235, partial [Bacteroidota bacterium]